MMQDRDAQITSRVSGCYSYPKANGLTGHGPSMVLSDWLECELGLGGNPGSLGKPKFCKTMEHHCNQRNNGLHGVLPPGS